MEDKKIQLRDQIVHNYKKTQNLIQKIQKEISGVFITYWLHPNASIYDGDIPALHSVLRNINENSKAFIMIKSLGGNGMSALRLVHLLREKFDNIDALLVSECASASTMLALGANKIFMSSQAYLSAIDTSLIHPLSPFDQFNNKVRVSLDELHRVTRLWRENSVNEEDNNPYEEIFKYIHPLVIGAVDRASSLSIRLCDEILSYHMEDREKRQTISNTLNNDYPQHGYPITFKEAVRIGINAEKLPPKLEAYLIELDEIYAETSDLKEKVISEVKYKYVQVSRIFETESYRCFFLCDEEKFYRNDERRWITLEDDSDWYIFDKQNKEKPKVVYF